jgi:predicted glycoside hydrolase/deacetylase ChbG (UPF0249 family)
VVRRLIVNADDFGFAPGNNKGIVECLAAGVVRSVSVSANGAAAQEAPRLVERFPDVSVGIHLDLSEGPCVCDPRDIPDLATERGEFLQEEFRRKAMRGRIPHDQMVRELAAQVERLRGYGVSPTHWDSHQNLHLYPPFFRAALEVANRFGIRRMRTHDHHLYGRRGGRKFRAAWHLLTHPHRAAIYTATRWLMHKARRAGMHMADRLISVGLLDDSRKRQRDFWVSLFRTLPTGISEIYCHPSYPDDPGVTFAHDIQGQMAELEILRDPELAAEARRSGVELVSFRAIPVE